MSMIAANDNGIIMSSFQSSFRIIWISVSYVSILPRFFSFVNTKFYESRFREFFVMLTRKFKLY